MIAQKISPKQIFNWSNTNFSHSIVHFPKTNEEVRSLIKEATINGQKIIGRGTGRNYSDQSLNDGHIVFDMTKMNRILDWDKVSGILKVEAGATYEQVLAYCLSDGWVLGAIPGTRYVTMGGALSNNVHGKNSYLRGNFGEWVREFKLVLASSEICLCSVNTNSKLFFAAIGGAGLFGIVTEITLQLVRIPSPKLTVKKVTASSLNNLIDTLDQFSKENDFAIAQVDCFAKNGELGRGTIHGGSFIEDQKKDSDLKTMQSISKTMFGIFPKKWIPIIGRYFLNDYIMRLVSWLKYLLDKRGSSGVTYVDDIFHFTFLLDQVLDWQKVFRHGLFEYEPLIPKDRAREVIPQLISLTHKYDMPAYLSAIKIHKKDDFLISYSMDGYSFAMDIPRRPKEKDKQNELFREMNKIIIQVGGIVYLAKDINLNQEEFRSMYRNIDQFLFLKKEYDPKSLFESDMYRRIFDNNTKL